MTYNKKQHTLPHRVIRIETLEDRTMLSTVSIFAQGELGEENMNLLIDNVNVQSWENVSTVGDVFTFETDETVSADQIRIEFTNDLYQPENDIDRNLIVDRIEIDGEVFQTEAPAVFSTGAWDNNQGAIVSGYGKGETLHANGYFQYGVSDDTLNHIEFAGRTWSVVNGSTTTDNLFIDNDGGNDLLTMRGTDGALAISTQVEIFGDSRYELTLDAFRDFFGGEIGGDGPWASVGVNYYSVDSELIKQDRVDINSATSNSTVYEFDAVDEAETAFLWIWIAGFEQGVDIPINVRAIDWQSIDDLDDFEPPTASFNDLTFNQRGETIINFGVRFVDNQRLDQISQGAITVTGPNGFTETPPIAIGAPDNTDSNQLLVFFVTAPNSEWTNADNGIYTVTLNDEAVSDAAGNFAAGTVLGEITVNITPPPVDTTPPVVEVVGSIVGSVITEPPQGGRGTDIEFTVNYTDDQRLGEIELDRILVEGPNGYSEFTRGIAGFPIEGGRSEVTYTALPADGVWSSNENGVYTIRLLDETVADFQGNFAPGGVLATFEVRLDTIG